MKKEIENKLTQKQMEQLALLNENYNITDEGEIANKTKYNIISKDLVQNKFGNGFSYKFEIERKTIDYSTQQEKYIVLTKYKNVADLFIELKAKSNVDLIRKVDKLNYWYIESYKDDTDKWITLSEYYE